MAQQERTLRLLWCWRCLRHFPHTVFFFYINLAQEHWPSSQQALGWFLQLLRPLSGSRLRIMLQESRPTPMERVMSLLLFFSNKVTISVLSIYKMAFLRPRAHCVYLPTEGEALKVRKNMSSCILDSSLVKQIQVELLWWCSGGQPTSCHTNSRPLSLRDGDVLSHYFVAGGSGPEGSNEHSTLSLWSLQM